MTTQNQECCLPSKEEQTLKSPNNSAFPPPSAREDTQRTVWASIGLGVLASACCWLPLALAGAGVATGTLGAKIAWIRPWALGALALLGVGVIGWWARKRYGTPKGEEDCCAVVPKFPTLAVMILAASFVFAWASPRLLHPGRSTTLTAFAPTGPAEGTFLVISTPQFDCPPCVGTLPKAMVATPGVASVQMDFDKRETRILFQPGAAVDSTMARWKKELGFDGKEVRRESALAPTQGNLGFK